MLWHLDDKLMRCRGDLAECLQGIVHFSLQLSIFCKQKSDNEVNSVDRATNIKLNFVDIRTCARNLHKFVGGILRGRATSEIQKETRRNRVLLHAARSVLILRLKRN